jgi:hypothetical protein
MAKHSTKFQRVVADLELSVGPVVTGPASHTGPVFVAVFGKREGSTRVEVLGTGNLVKDTVVLGGPDTVTALKAGAQPTLVGFAWVRIGSGHTDARTVRGFGTSEINDQPNPDMWAIELTTPTKAPLPVTMPPGSSPASGWCFLFPWLSMCHPN